MRITSQKSKHGTLSIIPCMDARRVDDSKIKDKYGGPTPVVLLLLLTISLCNLKQNSDLLLFVQVHLYAIGTMNSISG